MLTTVGYGSSLGRIPGYVGAMLCPQWPMVGMAAPGSQTVAHVYACCDPGAGLGFGYPHPLVHQCHQPIGLRLATSTKLSAGPKHISPKALPGRSSRAFSCAGGRKARPLLNTRQAVLVSRVLLLSHQPTPFSERLWRFHQTLPGRISGRRDITRGGSTVGCPI